MVKIFMTGDNHFGKKYDRYRDVKELLIQSRFDVLKNMVIKAEMEACELFVVTGDLFNSVKTVKVSDVNQVVDILAAYNGTVLVLPGNHDYYTDNEKVWNDFEKALSSREHNIIILKEFKKYVFDVGDEKVNVYPALCKSKHSKNNNLEWIKNEEFQEDGMINIGIAHGAIEGVTPDMNKEYFLMTESELKEIPVDAWLIGHTHVPYPSVLKEDEDTIGYKIFNAGTHEQTDLHNNSEGNGFIITIEKKESIAKVSARKFISGKVHFYDIGIRVKPDRDDSLAIAIKTAFEEKDRNAIVRISISGTIRQEEYLRKEKIYQELLEGFLAYEIEDSLLSEEINVGKIRSEFAETSFAAQFMEQLIDNPIELQMAYQLIQECKEQ